MIIKRIVVLEKGNKKYIKIKLSIKMMIPIYDVIHERSLIEVKVFFFYKRKKG